MSFERFSTSDVYIFEHVGGFIQCCGCLLSDYSFDNDSDGFPEFHTPREALWHLDDHEKAGHDTGHARTRILADYDDLDIRIEPYVEKAEVRQRRKDRFDELFEDFKQGYKFPPEQFRDKGNGE